MERKLRPLLFSDEELVARKAQTQKATEETEEG
jgi:hypothetical protein